LVGRTLRGAAASGVDPRVEACVARRVGAGIAASVGFRLVSGVVVRVLGVLGGVA